MIEILEFGLPLIIAALGGGGAVKLIEFLWTEKRLTKEQIEKKKADGLLEDERIVQLVVKSIAQQRDDALRLVRELQNRVETMSAEIQGLRLAQGRDPFPRWIVDAVGRYQFVNSNFEDMFLRPQGLTGSSIINKTHEDVWPPKVAQTLHDLDRQAKGRYDGRAKTTMEMLDKIVTVYKLPIRHGATGAVLGFEGWITDIQEMYEQPGKGVEDLA